MYSHKPEKRRIAAVAGAIAFFLASYRFYAALVPANWLTNRQMENEIEDIRVYYLDEESGEKHSQSLFFLG